MYIQVDGLKKKLGKVWQEIYSRGPKGAYQLWRHLIGVAASPDEGEDLSSGVPPLGDTGLLGARCLTKTEGA